MFDGKNMQSGQAPLALFVYNRPEHTRRTIESLKACHDFEQSPLFVFCDGPRSARDADAVSRTRRLVLQVVGSNGRVFVADENKGLARSIIDGVTKLCDAYGRVIVIEDDLLVCPDFITYMNHALDTYGNDARVMQVSGFMFPIPDFNSRNTALFLPLTTSWGWGTWKHAWRRFDPAASGWDALSTDCELRRAFNVDGAFDYAAMLSRQMSGALDSWAIRWYWSVFREKGLVLYPPISLVENIGFDGSGTHGWRRARHACITHHGALFDFNLPETPVVNPGDMHLVSRFLRVTGTRKIVNSLGTLLKNVLSGV